MNAILNSLQFSGTLGNGWYAFQMSDDILDYLGDPKKLAKNLAPI